ncbi:class I SAM-dependent methyltransferase [Aquimarina sp. 2-A2]|uniref:class I SAM-dependent methyltransferase n=1 Tax=Aquimarina sp. 2-A2 TaxID=3382644 RepID=UPI00387F1BEF
MIQTEVFNNNVEAYEVWYDEHKAVYESEIAALRAQLEKLPATLRGIEVGVGTGRFSKPLGIKEGIEPATEMADKAIRRGVEIIEGTAERLPYKDIQFDFVMFVTICHLSNVKAAFKEAYRVLKRGGSIIVGFLDKDQTIARSYLEKRNQSTFYRNATFYTVTHIIKLLKEVKFIETEFNQTLFGKLEDIKKIQEPKEGYGEGSFVVVKAIKR